MKYNIRIHNNHRYFQSQKSVTSNFFIKNNLPPKLFNGKQQIAAKAFNKKRAYRERNIISLPNGEMANCFGNKKTSNNLLAVFSWSDRLFWFHTGDCENIGLARQVPEKSRHTEVFDNASHCRSEWPLVPWLAIHNWCGTCFRLGSKGMGACYMLGGSLLRDFFCVVWYWLTPFDLILL